MAMPAEFIAHCTIYSIQDTCISLIIIGDIHDLGFQLVHVQKMKEAQRGYVFQVQSKMYMYV